MSEIERRIVSWWPIVAALLAFVVWMVRLEGKVGMTEKQMEALQTGTISELRDVKVSLKELMCQTQSLEGRVIELRTIISRRK